MVDEDYILTEEKICFHHTKLENLNGILAEGLKLGQKHDENGNLKKYYKLCPKEPERIFVLCFYGNNTSYEKNLQEDVPRKFTSNEERKKVIIKNIKAKKFESESVPYCYSSDKIECKKIEAEEKIWFILNNLHIINKGAEKYGNAILEKNVNPQKIIAILLPKESDIQLQNLELFKEIETSLTGRLFIRNCPVKIS